MVFDPERDGPRVVHLVHKDGTAEAVDHTGRLSAALYGDGARFADDTLTYPAALAYLLDEEPPVVEHDEPDVDDDGEVSATEPHHHEPEHRTVPLDDDATGADE